MIRMRLQRDRMTTKSTPGVLEVFGAGGERLLTHYTIELAWKPSTEGGLGGEKGHSCVPPGVYGVEPFVRESGAHVWIVSNPALDVFKLPGDAPPARAAVARDEILIHTANYARELLGCIAPGLARGIADDGEPCVWQSADAMRDLHRVLDGQADIQLEIFGAPGAPPARTRKARRAPKRQSRARRK